MRIATDGQCETSSPFIFAVEVNKYHIVFKYLICFILFFRAWVFEVWVEKRRLFGPIDMSEAIAGFLHLAFVFDLEYPEGAQTLGDILQRKFANYGDDTG